MQEANAYNHKFDVFVTVSAFKWSRDIYGCSIKWLSAPIVVRGVVVRTAYSENIGSQRSGASNESLATMKMNLRDCIPQGIKLNLSL